MLLSECKLGMRVYVKTMDLYAKIIELKDYTVPRSVVVETEYPLPGYKTAVVCDKIMPAPFDLSPEDVITYFRNRGF